MTSTDLASYIPTAWWPVTSKSVPPKIGIIARIWVATSQFTGIMYTAIKHFMHLFCYRRPVSRRIPMTLFEGELYFGDYISPIGDVVNTGVQFLRTISLLLCGHLLLLVAVLILIILRYSGATSQFIGIMYTAVKHFMHLFLLQNTSVKKNSTDVIQRWALI